MAEIAKKFAIIVFLAFRDRVQPFHSRLNLVQVIGAIGLALSLSHLLQLQVHAITSDESSTRPNIIFIMADDLGYGDLGCYGQKDILTPNIDQLARDGIRFTQAYAGSTVCAPSRSSLMTGMHNGHNRVRDNVPHYEDYLQEEDVTLADVLKNAGYRCGGIGKWSLGMAGTTGRATKQGFDMFFGYLDQDHAHYYFPEYMDDNDGRLEMPDNPQSKEHYSHDLMTDRALQFIRESSGGPFFFYGAYTVPHFSHPSECPTKFAVPSDEPYSDRHWDQASKNYAAMITRLDADVGRIVALIAELGLTENTLVIFTSDNGAFGGAPKRFRSSGPLRGRKRELYEGGIRVPFIARWPGKIPKGKVSDEIIAFWDMLPTLAELAGAAVPAGIDGRSATNALRGGKLESPHEYLYWDYGHCRPKFSQAVRLGDWKGVRNGQENAIELYDLKTDLGETTDIANAHPDVVGKIETIMTAAYVESERYPLGQVYHGQSKWVQENAQPPNIVLIVADDLGYGDVGCYGSTLNKTPNIDRLAATGLRFTDFHSNGPMCTPTRAAMLTGLYQQRFGKKFDGPLSGKITRNHGLPLEAVTIAEVLKTRNYASACFGKWHLGYIPPWLPTGQGFDVFRGLGSGDGDHHTHIDRSGREDWWHNNEIAMEEGYTADLLTNYSIEFIERHKQAPFFLYVPHLAIHFPWQGPNDPPHREQGKDYWDDKWGIIPNPANVAPHIKAMVESVDASVGQIVATLERLQLTNRTLVVFTSDNGGYLTYGPKYRNISSNGPLRDQKGSVYEGGHRVPAIFHWPGRIEPGVGDRTALSIDLLPTFAAITKTDTAGLDLDGIDLSPLLFQRKALPARDLFWRMKSQKAVRRGPWKLVEERPNQVELYNLEEDLGEKNNLADEKPDLVKGLSNAWNRWEADVNRSAEAYR